MKHGGKYGGTLVWGALAGTLWMGVALTPAVKIAAAQNSASGQRDAAPRADENQIRETLAALGPGFRRSETRRFVVLSDGDASWTRTRANLLETTAERFDDALSEMGLVPQPARSKLLCVLIADHDRFEAFATAQDGVLARWIGGYYAVKSNRIVFFDPRTSPDFAEADEKLDEARRQAERAEERATAARREGRRDVAEAYRAIARTVRNEVEGNERSLGRQAARSSAAKTAHEAAHLLAFNRGLQMRSMAYPFWMSEGFATCFEPLGEQEAQRGRFGPGHAVPQRDRDMARAFTEGRVVSLRTLLTIDEPSGDGEAVSALYAQAHSLFRFLYEQDARALGGLFVDIARENGEAATSGGARHLQLFEARFGDPAVVERKWRSWAERASLAAVEGGE